VKKIVLFLTFAGAALAGVFAWNHFPRTHRLSEPGLTFANLQTVTMRDVVSATGHIEPREIVVVASELPGTVVRLSARVNDTVAEGAELASLDRRKIAHKLEEARNGVQMAGAALAQAKSAVTQARASREAAALGLKYQEELASKGGFRSDRDQAQATVRATEAGVEAAQAGVEMAQSKLEAARIMLRDAELAYDLAAIKVPALSPRSGAPREFLILERKVHEGQMVGPQSGPLFTLAGSLQTVEVHAQVAEGDVNRVKQGLPAVFVATSFDDAEVEFRGVVKDVRPLASNLKGAVYYDTVIEVANQKDPVTGAWRLRPGMTASVDIVRREHRNVWRVPSAALNFQLEEPYQTDAAKARLAEWKLRSDAGDWQTLWVWDPAERVAVPRFVRIGGVGRHGEPGLKDSEGNEALEWAPGEEPPAGTAPRVIVGAPPAHTPGLFDRPPPIKVS
jgi:HlyD family secretion protein